MPIRLDLLERRLVAADHGETVDELRERVTAIGDEPVYVVVSLPDRKYSAALLAEVARAVSLLGPSALELALSDIPSVGRPTASVERDSIGFGEAERLRDRQPTGRLVVLEDGKPVGLLTNERRGMGAGGVPFDLFGASRGLLERRLGERRPTETCSDCGWQFAYYKVDPERKEYCCPSCGSAQRVG